MKNIHIQKLPVIKILLGSVVFAWLNKEKVIKSIALPTLIMVAIWAMQVIFEDEIKSISAWIVLPFYLVGFSIFAVTCHRLVLLDKYSNFFSIRFKLREIIFAGWMLIIYIIYNVVLILATEIILNLPYIRDATNMRDVMYYATSISSIPSMYFLARLSLAFPATAIDKVPKFNWSWQQTKGNGWRITVIVGLYPWILNSIIWLLSREEATIIENTITKLLYYLVLAIEVFALSLTYKILVNDQKINEVSM